MFCVINKCDSNSKKWCFLSKWMVIEKCDTNKNVTKMGVITKGVYLLTTYLPFIHVSTCYPPTRTTQGKGQFVKETYHHHIHDDEKMLGFNINLDINNHFNIIGVHENKKIT